MRDIEKRCVIWRKRRNVTEKERWRERERKGRLGWVTAVDHDVRGMC